MQLDEWMPPTFPSSADQEDALQKGLGRAVIWARAGLLEISPLLGACLRDLRYDAQVESVRGAWLWELIVACNAVDRLRGPVFEALARLPEDSAEQLCSLARYFAGTDGAFRGRLREVVRTKPRPEMHWLGEDHLIALEGEGGFEFAAGVRGERLTLEPWDWAHTVLMEDAFERWGRDRTVRLLEDSVEPGAQTFLDAWRGQPTPPVADGGHAHRARMRAIPVADVLMSANGETGCHWFRPWGANADDADLRIVLDAACRERDPKRLSRLLRVFALRTLPVFDARLVDVARHDDAEVRTAALRALTHNAHPLVRSLGLELLADPNRVTDAVALFTNNYVGGDEVRIRAALSHVKNVDLHYALMDAERLLAENPLADPVPIGLYVYRHTPCGHCRASVAGLLRQRDLLPAWVLDELRFDSREDARALVADAGDADARKF
jgi:hypothetical protein